MKAIFEALDTLEISAWLPGERWHPCAPLEEGIRGIRWYTPDGEPMPADSVETWTRVEGYISDYRMATEFPGLKVGVSTSYFGHHMGLQLTGPALIFETCVFAPEKVLWLLRYCTWAAAKTGHAAVCKAITDVTGVEGRDA